MNLTERAIAKLNTLKEEGKALRVAVVGGGCSGLSYNMKWVTLGETTLQDKVLSFGDLSVVIDPKSALFLGSVELDYSDDLNDSGFKWTNPSAQRTCGCGNSFS
jgi:iron-sulfur cluster assembly protein